MKGEESADGRLNEVDARGEKEHQSRGRKAELAGVARKRVAEKDVARRGTTTEKLTEDFLISGGQRNRGKRA